MLRLISLVTRVFCFVILMANIAQVNAAEKQADLIKRGAYIATAADCSGCHTGDKSKPYAGGAPLESSLGKFYPSNITPDPKTGIGKWSMADFKRSLHQGLNENGEYLYPAMPYESYTKMTDEDADALWAYLQSLEPINNEVPAPDLIFPANLRFGLGVWRELYFKPGRFKPNPQQDATYNRGDYLVNALGHCSSCHTPRNLLLAKKEDQDLTGAKVNDWYAPNIGSGKLSSIKDWSVDELATFLKTGELGIENVAVGDMSIVIHHSLSQLNDSDIHAMATYLKTMDAGKQQDAAEDISVTKHELASGESIYELNCQSCHGSNGEGADGVGPALAGNNTVTGQKPDNIFISILEGFNPQNAWGAMPSFANTLNNSDIADVSNYIRTSWGNKAEPNATTEIVSSSRSDANIPEGGMRDAVICPNLPREMIEPALKPGSKALLAANDDPVKLEKLVADYKAARANSSASDIIQSLSAAYCRAVVENDPGYSERNGRIVQFAGKVAEVAVAKKH